MSDLLKYIDDANIALHHGDDRAFREARGRMALEHARALEWENDPSADTPCPYVLTEEAFDLLDGPSRDTEPSPPSPAADYIGNALSCFLSGLVAAGVARIDNALRSPSETAPSGDVLHAVANIGPRSAIHCRRCGDDECGPWGLSERGVWQGHLLCEPCLEATDTHPPPAGNQHDK